MSRTSYAFNFVLHGQHESGNIRALLEQHKEGGPSSAASSSSIPHHDTTKLRFDDGRAKVRTPDVRTTSVRVSVHVCVRACGCAGGRLRARRLMHVEARVRGAHACAHACARACAHARCVSVISLRQMLVSNLRGVPVPLCLDEVSFGGGGGGDCDCDMKHTMKLNDEC